MEFEGSKRPFSVPNTDGICQMVGNELAVISSKLYWPAKQRTKIAPSQKPAAGAFLLQRWSTRWEACKAFGSVPHLPLLQKLKDIDLNQYILQWISSCLCNRQQYVVVEGASTIVLLLSCLVSLKAQFLGPCYFYFTFLSCNSLMGQN